MDGDGCEGASDMGEFHRIRVTAIERTSLEQLSAFLFRPGVVARWIGDGARLTPRVGRSTALPTPSGSVRAGTVTDLHYDDSRHEVTVTATGVAHPETTSFRVTSGADGRARLRIEVRDLPDAAAARAQLRMWQEALNRLRRMLAAQLPRRPHAKQALVVVHGIGEQLPGQTLRSFVDSVFREDAVGRWVKPDSVSSSFEMRKITVAADFASGRPTTDVYELYWANLIRDTSFGQVAWWMLRLLLTPQKRLPPKLRGDLWIARLLVVLGLALTGAVALALGKAIPAIPAVVITIIGLVWAIVVALARLVKSKILINFVGDAARYLKPRPDNVAIRQQIREAGVDLLERLHAPGRYDRIVVFGHSLGSVIAYDILTFAWIRFGRRHRSPEDTDAVALTALERYREDAGGSDTPAVKVQDLQHAAWQEARRNTLPWLVTDFVSAGSPLTHADLLLPIDKTTDVAALIEDRVFPTCPPVTEEENGPRRTVREVFSYAKPYADVVTGETRTLRVPHHAAPFAFTRWTNLYFPCTGLLRGDPVGGPLAGTFGDWIDDRALDHPGAGALGFAHTLYWDDTTPSTTHLDVLRASLRLDASGELVELRQDLPLREE